MKIYIYLYIYNGIKIYKYTQNNKNLVNINNMILNVIENSN